MEQDIWNNFVAIPPLYTKWDLGFAFGNSGKLWVGMFKNVILCYVVIMFKLLCGFIMAVIIIYYSLLF